MINVQTSVYACHIDGGSSSSSLAAIYVEEPVDELTLLHCLAVEDAADVAILDFTVC